MLIRCFLYDEVHASHPDQYLDDGGKPIDSSSVNPLECPQVYGNIAIHHVAHATFYAPTELATSAGMHCELIRANPSWHGHPRFDTVLINADTDKPSMRGMMVGHIMGLMAVQHDGTCYPCALIDWFDKVSEVPSDVTGMYEIQPELDEYGQQVT